MVLIGRGGGLCPRGVFYVALCVEVSPILTVNSRECCGRRDGHPGQLLLAMEEINQRATKIRSTRTHGFVERMNRTFLDEVLPRRRTHDVVRGAGGDQGRPGQPHRPPQPRAQPPGLLAQGPYPRSDAA